MNPNLPFHGRSLDTAVWVIENFGNTKVQEFYSDNISFNQWIEDCTQIVAAEVLNY